MKSVEVAESGDVLLRESPEPTGLLAPGHVRLRMLAVGICGTDLALASGSRVLQSRPWRLGHEGVAEVAECGRDVQDLNVGDCVAIEPNVTCGRCRWCRVGKTSACQARRSAGVLSQPGLFTEVIDFPAEFVHVTPPDLDLADVVCAEPLAVAVAAVRRANVRPESTVLVLGGGAQGLLTTQVLVSQGQRPWILEPKKERLRLAVHLGARQFVPGSGVTPDRVIDASGVPEALGSVVDDLQPYTEVTVVGESHRHLGVSSLELVQRQILVRGSFIYDHPGDMRHAVELLSLLPTAAILDDPVMFDELPPVLLPIGRGSLKAWAKVQ